jgi:hypothetical protein
MRRRLHWLAIGALVGLAGRALAYALVPRPTVLSVQLEQQVGGPRPVSVAVVALLVALVLGAGIVGVAALAVRERHLLSGAPGAPPVLRLFPLLRAALLLWISTSLAFAALEAYVHWRAGLGFHGLHCLVGPVHRDALPLLAGLAVVAAAAEGAVRHLVGWMRRTFGAQPLRAFPIRPVDPPRRPRSTTPSRPLFLGLAAPRGPPAALPAR